MIEAVRAGLATACLWLGGVGMVVVAVAAIALNLRRMARIARRSRIRGTTAAVLCAVGGVSLLYGGRKGRVSYPYVDWEQRWLLDSGSYVTNDFVHLDYTRIVVPSSAPVFVAARQVASTNDLDWAVVTNTTFAAWPPPQDLPFPAATNYDWIVYTTWTPGPTVTTNGVWHSYWGLDKSVRRHIIPIRSAVRVDGEVIATPKSKREADQNED